MAKIPTTVRNKLPGKVFAGPNRSFPLTNKSHAAAAIRDVPRAEKTGSITKSEGAKIDAKARSKLGNFGGKAAKPFGTAKASPAPKPAASKMSADDKAIGMHKTVKGMPKGHNTYT